MGIGRLAVLIAATLGGNLALVWFLGRWRLRRRRTADDVLYETARQVCHEVRELNRWQK